MILTDDEGIAARCRSLRNLFFNAERRFVHEELGWNLRMGSLQAALGIAQLERLDEFISHKKGLGRQYGELLSCVPGLALPAESAHGSENHYWVFGVVLDESLRIDAAAAIRALAAEGVGTRPFFYPMHRQPVFGRMGLDDGCPRPVAERLAARGLYLPSGLNTQRPSIDFCASKLASLLEVYARLLIVS